MKDEKEMMLSYRTQRNRAQEVVETWSKLFFQRFRVLPEDLINKKVSKHISYEDHIYKSQGDYTPINGFFRAISTGESNTNCMELITLKKDDVAKVCRLLNMATTTQQETVPLMDNDLSNALYGNANGVIPVRLLDIFIKETPHEMLLAHIANAHLMPLSGKIPSKESGMLPVAGTHNMPRGAGAGYGEGGIAPGDLPVVEGGLGTEYKNQYKSFPIEATHQHWYTKYSMAYLKVINKIFDYSGELAEDFKNIFARNKDINMAFVIYYAQKAGKYYRAVDDAGTIYWDDSENAPRQSDISASPHKFAVWTDIDDSGLNGIFGNSDGDSTYAEDCRAAGAVPLATYDPGENKLKRAMLYACQMVKANGHQPDFIILNASLMSRILAWKDLGDNTKIVGNPIFSKNGPYKGTLAVGGRGLEVDLYEIPDELCPPITTLHETGFNAKVHFMAAGSYDKGVGYGIADPFAISVEEGLSVKAGSTDVMKDNMKQYTVNSWDCIYPKNPKALALVQVVVHSERTAVAGP